MSEVDYFARDAIQLAQVNEFVRKFGTGQTIVQGAPIEFYVRGADGLSIDLNNSLVEVKVKLTKDDATDIGVDDVVGPVNDLFNSLFSTVELEVAGVLVTEPNTKYPYRAMIENLINYGKDVQDTRLLCEGWTKDTSGQMGITDPTGDNAGLKTRTTWFTLSKTVTLCGRPHLDHFHQEKLIPPSVDLKLRLVPNSHKFLLKTKAGTQAAPQVNYKVQIVSANFIVQTKVFSPSFLMAQEKLLQTNNFVLPMNKVDPKTLMLPTGTSQIEFDNVYQGKLPDLVTLAFVADADMAGGYQNNPFNFQNFGVNYLAMQANGDLVPRIPYQPNFTTGDYISDYLTVMRALGQDNGPNCWNLTPTEWANGYNIYAFKLTPGPIGTVRSAARVGSVRLILKFAAATQANITVIMHSQQYGEHQMDKYKTWIAIA